MAGKDGRHATQPYRIRVGDVWYWVDPTAPSDAIEPGDTVVVYPTDGDAYLATLKSSFPGTAEADALPVAFASLDGRRFDVPAGAIATLHLAAVDDEQG